MDGVYRVCDECARVKFEWISTTTEIALGDFIKWAKQEFKGNIILLLTLNTHMILYVTHRRRQL